MEKFIDTQYLKPTFSGTPLLVHIYQNGGVVVKDGEKLVAMVEGDFSFPGEKIDKHIFFDEGHSRNLNDLESCANVGDGSKALLSGSLKKILNGFEIEYDMNPSKTFDVHLVDASVRLNYDDWKGSDYQIGFERHTLTLELSGAHKDPLQCIAFIGPSEANSQLFMEINGNDELGISASDNRYVGQPCFTFHVEANKAPFGTWQWKQNDKKQINFSVLFNRPVSIADQVYPQKEFDDIRAAMFKKPFVVATPTVTTTMNSPEETTSLPNYSIPANAKNARFYFDGKTGFHMFVPAEFSILGKTYKGSLNWDTGVPTENGGLNLTRDFILGLKLKNLQQEKIEESVLNSYSGGYAKKVNQEYCWSNDVKTNGNDDVEVKIGDLKIENPSLFTSQSLEGVYLKESDPKAEFLKEYPAVGLIPFYLMRQYLISIDYKNNEMYFRPLDSKVRTFFAKKPLKVFEGEILGEGFYLPIEINKSVRGLATLDTGAPFCLVDPDTVNISCFPIQSCQLGGVDVTTKFRKATPFLFKNLRFQSFIANIGNDFFENSFITIDPRDQKIYVEK